MLEPIKSYMQKKALRELRSVQRQTRIENIKDINTICVVCQLGEEQEWNVIAHFNKVMSQRGKTVSTIAIQDKEINFVVADPQVCICHTKTDLNHWGIPREEVIHQAVSRHYDLLIDTLGSDRFFAQYIALRTDASLKAVYFTGNDEPTDIFDLIIRGEEPIDLKGYFNHVIEYLAMINK